MQTRPTSYEEKIPLAYHGIEDYGTPNASLGLLLAPAFTSTHEVSRVPLKYKSPIPIVVPPQVGAVAPGAAKLLTVGYIRQEQTNWCWAGCCQMVFNFYGVRNVRQCDMATAQFGASCCASPSSSACNQGNWPENTYRHYGFNCNKSNGAFALGSVQAEVNANRPLEPYYAWNGGGAHVAVVRGFYDNGDLEVNDPWYGPGRRAYSYVVRAYNLGNWTITYSNLRK